ncbi:MAG TPA: site-specific DNA-methyltransferase [Candidatus Acidoferrum sp.]|nr:site-specific DNA-methyltransferase [Candidatus Acidoferrum sp.]
MARGKGKNSGTTHPKKRAIDRYEHTGKKRVNNPPVGLVTPETDPPLPTHKVYDYIQPVPEAKPSKELSYDPHLDPQLVWAGKKEHASFEVPTVSLHVHETIDPRTIIEAVRKRNGNGYPIQPSLFERPEEKMPLRDAIEFYRHAHGWSNRLIAGDSLLVMNSLLEKEGMAGQVQMVYIDPPYGIKYGSNFQPFVNKRDVKDGKDEDLTQEPEMIRAFRDTWELGIHSYLTYLRDRLLLARELLQQSGSCFVQISDENIHHVREVLDEVFGNKNFISIITIQKTTSSSGDVISTVADFLLWYAKDASALKSRPTFLPRAGEGWVNYDFVRLRDGTHRKMTKEEREDWSKLPAGAEVYRRDNLTSQRPAQEGDVRAFSFDGRDYAPGKGTFKTDQAGLERLGKVGRLEAYGETLAYRRFASDFPYRPLSNVWTDTLTGGFAEERYYVVQTITKVVQRCVLISTDPGDLVLDPTCGSGTTAYVAEEWGRRWITCDTSRVAVTLAKQRLMTAEFEYYELAHPEEGVGSGFRYKTVPHIMLKSITNNPEMRAGMTHEQIDAAITRYADQETLYDQPNTDKNRVRVTGPFTLEAVPAPTVRSLDEIDDDAASPRAPSNKAQQSIGDFRDVATPLLDASVSRKGATLRHAEWRDELLKTGLRGKGGHHIDFSRVEPLAGTRWLHADAETKGAKPERVVFSFGPEHSLLEQRQVELAWEEARTLSPKPAILVFAAFEFDPEAAKDIDGMTKEKTGMTFLTAQMNADLLTQDLKKKRASNQGFWLVGRPDIELREIAKGDHKGNYEVEVRGFDYYDTRSGTIESGDPSKIAMWLLDTDYDGRSLYPRQVFFPMADDDEGWARLARNLKAEIDTELIEKYRGTTSLPFEVGPHKRVAVKLIDDRGIESLKVVDAK